jgi:DNA-binding protein Fis
MAQAGNRKKHAAELLGIANYQTLTNKLTRLGLPSGDKNE